MPCTVCGAHFQLFSRTFNDFLCHRCLLWACRLTVEAKKRESATPFPMCDQPECQDCEAGGPCRFLARQKPTFDGVGCA